MKMRKHVKVGIASLFFLQMYSTTSAQIHSVGSEVYIQGSAVEVGISGAGGFEGANTSAAPVPGGMHFRSNTQYFGFVANPQLNAWATFDGDFFTPGTPENGWGVEIGGTSGAKYHNNCNSELDIPGSILSTTNINGCFSVIWGGDLVDPGSGFDLDFTVEYQMNENDLFYTTKVKIINNGPTDVNDLYYYRNVDPDNNVSLSGYSDYWTTNTVENQPGGICSKALVSATQTIGGNSYLGFAGIDPNFRVGHGGFDNRDGSDMWTGTGFSSAVGSSAYADAAMFISYYIDTLAAGDTAELRFVVILDASQAENAVNSLFYFEYTGGLGEAPPLCTYEVDTIPSCPGKNVFIELLGENVNDFNWSWSPNIALDTLAGTAVNANPDSTITYTVTGTPINACFTVNVTQQIVVEMSQEAAMDFDIVLDNPNCLASDGSIEITNITGGIGGVAVQWTGGPAGPLYSGIPAGTYYVVLTDSLGCYLDETVYLENITTLTATVVVDSMALCANPSGQFTATAANGLPTYTYNIGAGPVTSGTFSGLAAGNYVVEIIDQNSCLIYEFVEIVDTSIIDMNLIPGDEICDGVNGQIQVNAINAGPGVTYTLGTVTQTANTFTGLASGSYTIVIQDNYGCADTATVTIGDTSDLAAVLVDTTAAICTSPNGGVVVQASNGLGTYTYTVPGSGSNATGTFTGLAPGPYNMTVTSGSCTVNVPFVVGMDNGDLSIALVSVTDENCGTFNGEIVTQASGGTTAYTYNIGGAPQASGTFDNLNDGSYVVTIVDANGCIDTLHAQLNEIPLEINLGPDITYCNQVTVQGNGVGSYLWSTGDVTNSITVTQTGTYWLAVTTPGGCSDIDSIDVTVLHNTSLFVPNVFTPNGDGQNDKLEISGMFIQTYRVTIMNRWGQVVYASSNLNEFWDGKFNGEPAAEGAYLYMIEYEDPCQDPVQQTLTGSIQLFR